MPEFDAFMVANAIGTNRKLRRLSVAERWCAVAGVWALASLSPIRGYLLVADGVPATAEDFAEQAGVSVAVARSTVAKMRELGMLEPDQNMGVEHVHAWHAHQREPSRKSSDSREAWRERKARQRARERDGVGSVTPPDPGDVTRDMSRERRSGHALEEKRREGNGNRPPQPPGTGGRERDCRRAQELYAHDLDSYVAAHPITDKLREQWEPIRGMVAGCLGTGHAAAYLASLHPHSLNGSLVLGATQPEMVLVIEQAIGRVIERESGLPVQIIPCGCEVRA